MAGFYNYYRQPPYDSNSKEPYKISRSKIDLFIQCPKCFYLDRKKRVSRPGFPPFTLNNAVDALLKKEFDLLRKDGKTHELMKQYNIDAIPFKHKDLNEWRENFKGARVLHEKTNFLITGAIDDIWTDKKGNIFIVDYKATSKDGEINLNDKWKDAYKRQMEVYQWIFRKLGFKVSNTGYFVFANAGKNKPKFDGKLEFVMTILPYKGDDYWVEPRLLAMKQCLDSPTPPKQNADCEYCNFRDKSNVALK